MKKHVGKAMAILILLTIAYTALQGFASWF